MSEAKLKTISIDYEHLQAENKTLQDKIDEVTNNYHISSEKLKNKAKNSCLIKAEEKVLKLKKEIESLKKQVRSSKSSLEI